MIRFLGDLLFGRPVFAVNPHQDITNRQEFVHQRLERIKMEAQILARKRRQEP